MFAYEHPCLLTVVALCARAFVFVCGRLRYASFCFLFLFGFASVHCFGFLFLPLPPSTLSSFLAFFTLFLYLFARIAPVTFISPQLFSLSLSLSTSPLHFFFSSHFVLLLHLHPLSFSLRFHSVHRLHERPFFFALFGVFGCCTCS